MQVRTYPIGNPRETLLAISRLTHKRVCVHLAAPQRAHEVFSQDGRNYKVSILTVKDATQSLHIVIFVLGR